MTKTPSAGTSEESEESDKKYVEPRSFSVEGSITLAQGFALNFGVTAGWITLRQEETPLAEVFYTSYVREPYEPQRPITFVLNGGPGSASAYLHLGALGPWRVPFGVEGDVPPSPRALCENPETWLEFTDVVFIDPVGTGFSRLVPEHKRDLPEEVRGGRDDDESPGRRRKRPDDNFHRIIRDLKSIAEFIRRYLDRTNRWGAPIYFCGESYGGFRGAKLSQLLQEEYGVSLTGIVLVSPALEFSLLSESNYSVLRYIDLLPSMAMTAAYHRVGKMQDLEEARAFSEEFAVSTYSRLLILGSGIGSDATEKMLATFAECTGLPPSFVERKGGRVGCVEFARELLRPQRRICGLYDASMVAIDPFPESDFGVFPDPSSGGIASLFTELVNSLLRSVVKVETEREYNLFSQEMFESWQNDLAAYYADLEIGSVDEMRYALSLNPSLKILICHGYFDLVTPYFASQRILHQMRLDPSQRDRVRLANFLGGHMFYSKEVSRREFREQGAALYRAAVT